MGDLNSQGMEHEARNRGRLRMAWGLNLFTSLVLLGVALFLVNALVWRFPRQYDLLVRYRPVLSDKTHAMLEGMRGHIDIIVLFDDEAPLFEQTYALLREYVRTANRVEALSINLELVNPLRDISRTRVLAQQHDLTSGNQILFLNGDVRRVVDVNQLAQYEYEINESGASRRMIGFLGEQVFSSALLSISEQVTPVVYFLTGHGERDINDFSRQRGYSTLARALDRENLDVRPLNLAEHQGVPDDCRALVIAGPEGQLADVEVTWIEDYLASRHGRLFVMLDPGVETGLEPLLARWGIEVLENGYVAGATTFTGQELVVTDYGDHPITRNFGGVMTLFYMPRPFASQGADAGGLPVGDEDRVRVAALAVTDERGWIETNYQQSPPVFNADTDRQGPIVVAMAAERGPVGLEAQINPTRIVAVGDSYFVSNAAISSGVGGNVSFFLASLNWLVDRDHLLMMSPRVPVLMQPEWTDSLWRMLVLGLVFGLPLVVLLLGGWVALARRR